MRSLTMLLLMVSATCACTTDDSKPAARTTPAVVPASSQGAQDTQAAQRAAAHEEEQRCAAFADRVVECNRGGAIRSDGEASSVRDIAYAVCTKTTDDAAALHYYGDVDRKMTCMRDKECLDVLVCLTRDEPVQ